MTASNSQVGSNTKPSYDFNLRTEEVKALGTSFKVVFADEGSRDDPVIVCIHGAPATHKAFRHIVRGLTSQGYRVIIPNLPGMGLTALDPDGFYNHTTEHKAAIIRELLAKIGVTSVAMVVGHSMGGHITCQLAGDPALEGAIRSICLLSSAGSRPHRLFSPYWLYFILGHLVYFSVKLPLIGMAVKRLICYFINSAGLRGLTRDSEVYSWYEGSQLHFPEFIINAERLVRLDMPALCVFSSNDKFIEMSVLQDTVHRLGVQHEDIIKYDKEGVTMETFRGMLSKDWILATDFTKLISQRTRELLNFKEEVTWSTTPTLSRLFKK